MKDVDFETIFSISKLDVNSIAKISVGRELTEDEMEIFKRKFTIHDWVEVVEHFVEYVVVENGI